MSEAEVKLWLPKTQILEPAWKRLKAYIMACPTEVGGIGAVRELPGSLTVTEVFLIKQAASGSDFELDEQGLAEFLDQWIRQGRDTAELKFWWHSHANLGPYWSVVDQDTSNRLAGDSYVLAFVGNRRHQWRTCLTVNRPLRLVVDDLQLAVAEEADEALMAAVQAEVDEKVGRSRGYWFRRSRGTRKADRSGFRPATVSPDSSDLDGGGRPGFWPEGRRF